MAHEEAKPQCHTQIRHSEPPNRRISITSLLDAHVQVTCAGFPKAKPYVRSVKRVTSGPRLQCAAEIRGNRAVDPRVRKRPVILGISA